MTQSKEHSISSIIGNPSAPVCGLVVPTCEVATVDTTIEDFSLTLLREDIMKSTAHGLVCDTAPRATYAQKLRALRVGLELTQGQAGALLGYTASAVSSWERGSRAGP